jgi:hypothetical protein
MHIDKPHLERASVAGVITPQQADDLWQFWLNQPDMHTPPAAPVMHEAPQFKFGHVLYYFGGMLAIGAMSLFMTVAWETFGGWGLFFIALAYFAIGLQLTERFIGQQLWIPAGLLSTLAIVVVPLGIYGLQKALGWMDEGEEYGDYFPLAKWQWVLMELGTLAAGTAVLWRYRMPFSVMPVAVTLWFLSMDIVQFLIEGVDGISNWDSGWELRRNLSLLFGLGMLALALWVDFRRQPEKDFAFWLYLFGVLTFWGSLTSMDSGSEFGKFLYSLVNIGLIFIGVLLSRRVFAVFGAMGVMGYLGYLSAEVFDDSLLFPLVLTLLGLGIVYVGVVWQRNENLWTAHLRGLLPDGIRQVLDKNQRG